MAVASSELAAYPLCAGLCAEQLAMVARTTHRVGFMPGTLVMSREQPGDAAYLVARGTLQVVIDQPDGASVILAVLGPRALVGELGVVQSAGRSASVVAVERSTLLAIHRDDFTGLLRAVPALALNLNAILAQRLRLANAQILTLSAGDPAARVARLLLTFAGEHGVSARHNAKSRTPTVEEGVPTPFSAYANASGSMPAGIPRAGAVSLPFRLTQSDLARFTGLSRGAVNKVLVDLARRGVLRTDPRQHLTLLDLGALEELAAW